MFDSKIEIKLRHCLAFLVNMFFDALPYTKFPNFTVLLQLLLLSSYRVLQKATRSQLFLIIERLSMTLMANGNAVKVMLNLSNVGAYLIKEINEICWENFE